MPTRTDRLPRSDHIVLYVRRRLLLHKNGDLIGVLPQAFEHREFEAYLSVTWLENFSEDYETGLVAAAGGIRNQFTVKLKDAFTAGQVGSVIDICDGYDLRVRVLHEPNLPENGGHSAIRGLQNGEIELLDMLASDVFTETRVASKILKLP